MVTDVDDTTFAEQVHQADGPVLVQAHASWCGPCKTLAPIVADFAASQDDVKVVAVDIDAAPHTARELAIMGVPTLLLFKDGALAARKTGAATAAQVAEFAGQ